MGDDGADAAPPTVAVWVDYRAPEGCPDHALLMSRISERNARLEESTEAPAPQRYRVIIQTADGEFSGRLEQPETRAVREVSGVDCARVVDALALVVALSATEEQKVEGVQATDERDETTPPVVVPPAKNEPTASDVTPADHGLALSRRKHASWHVAAGGVLLTGLAPAPLAGPVAGFDWAHDDGWFSLRGTGRWAFGLSDDASTWQLVPELCLWLPAGFVEVSACGGSAFGRVAASGTWQTWVAPLASLGFRAAFGYGAFGELRAEADFPLGLSERPTSAPFEPPPVTFGVTLMVGFGGELRRRGMKTSVAGHGGM